MSEHGRKEEGHEGGWNEAKGPREEVCTKSKVTTHYHSQRFKLGKEVPAIRLPSASVLRVASEQRAVFFGTRQQRTAT
ncbi:hypothetical protein AC579_1389 [Pseudocercospora musae]|uniref:Uncharacterized protein n=1 Tax=Pseudocercospora musae TaxID=113226 RepID=A0A139IFU6_9PEZI|nr:hypothetical protein AC579_1389 [Pseudocercospora musae]